MRFETTLGTSPFIAHLDDRPTLTIDSIPPELSLATFVPFEGERAGVGDALFASLSFNEPVTMASETLMARRNADEESGHIALDQLTMEPPTTTGHQWEGTVPADMDTALQGSTSSLRSPMTGRATISR